MKAFPLQRRTFLLWFAAGLALRLFLSPLYGTQDVEWQKAWGTALVHDGLTGIYGAPDAEILKLKGEGKSPEEVRAATQTVIPFQPYRYFRTEYRVTYPPGYLYLLYGSTQIYNRISPGVPNGRLFNVFVNLPSILAGALLAILIAVFVGSVVSPAAGYAASLLYWLNPVVILNSPVQGYQDPICALFAVLSVTALFRRRIAWACVFLAIGILVKPQAAFLLPVVVVAGYFHFPYRKNLLAWLAGAATAALIVLPYLLAGRILGVIQGVRSITDSSHDLSRQALNLWWPVQYICNAAAGTPWYADVPASRLGGLLGLPLGMAGYALFLAFTVFNVYRVIRRFSADRWAVLEGALLQVYAYFILSVGVQINHYHILIPLFAIVCLRSATALRLYAAASLLFLLQDLIFYGLGRDFNYGRQVLSLLHLGWTTNLLAAANVVLFAWVSRLFFRGDPSAANANT